MLPYRQFAVVVACGGLFTLSGCGTVPANPSAEHLRASDASSTDAAAGSVPAPVMASVNIPKPRAAAKTETYSVVVNNVKVQDLLFALARDAKLNIDIYPGIDGTVTLNAIDQTLQQLLARIAKQVDMRWELDGANLAVMPDTPYLRTYKVDYVNMSRDASTTISANSQITSGIAGSSSAAGGGVGGGGGAIPGAGGNVSITRVENKVSNHFWETLEKNIKDLLRETDKLLPEGSSETVVERSGAQSTTGTGAVAANGRSTRTTQQGIAGSPNPAVLQQDENTVIRRATFREAASVIVNPETGIVTVRATARQHEKIQEFLDQVTASARRQVMIEATIVEVELSSGYQQGINWSRLRSDGTDFLSLTSTTTTNTVDQGTPFSLKYVSNKNGVSAAINLLEQFGHVKVLSSPRLSVLNNQAALLKVVENKVYFTVKADVASATVSGAQPTKAVTTTPQSVSVGLVMTVTPQISDNNSITLNVRPSITSISNYVSDPSPELLDSAGNRIPNRIPEIRTREIESVMRVEDGQIAVLGGLMQESAEYNDGRLPGVGAIPLFGELFNSRNNATTKSELVVFLRPVVIRDPSVNGDYASLRNALPGDKFFTAPRRGVPFGMTGATDAAGDAQP